MVVQEVYQQVFMDGLTENPLEACFNFHKDKEISYLPSIKTENEHIIFVKCMRQSINIPRLFSYFCYIIY